MLWSTDAALNGLYYLLDEMLFNLTLVSKIGMSLMLKLDLWTGISISGSKAMQELISVYTLGLGDQV